MMSSNAQCQSDLNDSPQNNDGGSGKEICESEAKSWIAVLTFRFLLPISLLCIFVFGLVAAELFYQQKHQNECSPRNITKSVLINNMATKPSLKPSTSH